jgi:hypothetical protein
LTNFISLSYTKPDFGEAKLFGTNIRSLNEGASKYASNKTHGHVHQQ